MYMYTRPSYGSDHYEGSEVIGISTTEHQLEGVPELSEIEKVLDAHEIRLEVIPHKGFIDHDDKKIYVNPVIGSRAEILAHEALHGLHPEAPEWYALETARRMVADPDTKQYFEDYLDQHAQYIKGRGLSGMIGW